MNGRAWCWLVLASSMLTGGVRAETEMIDLKALAKKARTAVMLLVVSDAAGKEIATGTGFLVSNDGKLITNHHVIENAASAVAKAENGDLFPVEGVLAYDPKNDLVLLKLKGKGLPFLTLGNSDKIKVGTRIAVIGSPLGLEGTLTEGIVSAVRELMGDMKVLQVTATISSSSSGSPVLNAKGDVIGVAEAFLRGSQAQNFAVPVDCANRLLMETNAAAKPRRLTDTAITGEDEIFADPDYRAAIAAAANEDWGEYLKSAKALVVRYPDNVAAYRWLGFAYGRLKSFDEAVAAFRQAIRIKPDDAYAWSGLGVRYEKSGRTGDAIAAYRQAIKIRPDAIAWYGLGWIYGRCNRTDEAIAAYQQALKIKPDLAEAWYHLGIAYEMSGRTDEAASADAQARKLKPELFK